MRSKSASSERGLYLIVLATGLVGLVIILIGLVLGVGFISAGKSHLKAVGNMLALGSLENFVEGDRVASYETRLAAALQRANEIAAQNSLKFAPEALGSLTSCTGNSCPLSGGGDLTLGRWFPSRPTDSTTPCETLGKTYPCFSPNVGTDDTLIDQTNAARVRVCNSDPSNPILSPFMSGPGFKCTESIASLASVCAAFVVDISRSTAFDTHFSNLTTDNVTQTSPSVFRISSPTASGGAWDQENNPNMLSLPFYDQAVANVDCFSAASFSAAHLLWPQPLFWCSMPAQRPAGPANPRVHYRSDYRTRTIKDGRTMLVDVFYDAASEYYGPQPYESIFRGVNAALRKMQERRTGLDQAVLMIFQRDIVDREPDTGMADDLNYLIQLTNLDNRGLRDAAGTQIQPPVHPNFLDKGWIIDPRQYRTDLSNPVLALDVAIATLNAQCPTSSDKVILFYSDGVPSCARAYPGDTGRFQSVQTPNLGYDYVCGINEIAQRSLMSRALHQLGGGWNTTDWSHASIIGSPTVLTSLISNGIRLTSVLAGDHVGPNEINRYVPGTTRWMNQDEAVALNYGMTHQGWEDYNRWFVSTPALCPNGTGDRAICPGYSVTGTDPLTFACRNFPAPNFTCGTFPRYYGPMALDTGGVWCPLRPRCKPGGTFIERPTNPGSCTGGNCYGSDSELKPGVRIANQMQLCSTKNMNKSEQSADCALATIGGNPYVLVREGR